jgi:hypothetical protein
VLKANPVFRALKVLLEYKVPRVLQVHKAK